MSGLATTMLVNAAWTTLLALGLLAGERFIRRPALVHALWLILLIKLVTPSLVEWSVIPQIPFDTGLEQGVTPIASPASDSLIQVSPVVLSSSIPDSEISAADALWGIWLLGSLLVVGITVVRWQRFRKTLDNCSPLPPKVAERTDALARRMGLRDVPRIRAVPARITPMVWWRIGGAELLLPSGLVTRLDGDELDALLIHELAHLKRRDHWVRYLELLVSTLYWWHPVVWWARSRLRRAEEHCCDAWVLRILPGHPRVYAGALMKTLEFLAGQTARVPVPASGAGEIDHMKERLTMIMKRGARPRMSRFQSVLLAVATVAVLLVFPTWSERAGADAPTADPAESIAVKKDIIALERQATELERQVEQIRMQQRKLELYLVNKQHRQETDWITAQADRLEADGSREEAELVRRQIVRMRRQHEIETRALDLKTEMLRRMETIEAPLQDLKFEAETAEAGGDAYRAAELRAQAKKLKMEREMRLLKLKAIQEEMELGQFPAERSREATLRKLERKHSEILAKAELLASEDKVHAARELERKARDLERAMDEVQIRGEAR